MQSSSPTASRVIRHGSRSSSTVSSSTSVSPPTSTVSPVPPTTVSHLAPNASSILRIQQLQLPPLPTTTPNFYELNPYAEIFHRNQALERELSLRDKELTNLKTIIATKESIIQNFNSKIGYIEVENKRAYDDKKQQVAMNRQLEEKVRQYDIIVRAKDQEIVKLTQEVNQFASGNNQMKSLIQMNNELSEKAKKLENRVKTLDEALLKVNKENKTLASQLKVVKEDVEAGRKLLLQKDTELGKILQESNRLKGIQHELDKARGDQNHLKRINLDLNDQVALLQLEVRKAREELRLKRDSDKKESEKLVKETESVTRTNEAQVLKLQQALKAMKKFSGGKDVEITKLQRRNQGLEKVLTDTNTEIQKLTEEKNQLAKLIEEKDGMVKVANENYFRISESNTGIHDELRKLGDRAMALSKELEVAVGKCKKTEGEVEKLKGLLEKKDKATMELRERHQSRLKDVETEVNGLRNEAAELREEVSTQLVMLKEKQSLLDKRTLEWKAAEGRAKAGEGEVEKQISAMKRIKVELEEEKVNVKKGAEEVDKLTKAVQDKDGSLTELTNKLQEMEKLVKVAKQSKRPLVGEMKKVRGRVEAICGRVENMKTKLNESFTLIENGTFPPPPSERDAMVLLMRQFAALKTELKKTQDEVVSKNEEIEELIKEKERIEEDLRQQEDGIVQILQSRIESVEFTVSEVGSEGHAEVETSTAETQTEETAVCDRDAQTEVLEEPTRRRHPHIQTEEVSTQVNAPPQKDVSTQADNNEIVPHQTEDVSTQVGSDDIPHIPTHHLPAPVPSTHESAPAQPQAQNNADASVAPPQDDSVDLVDLTLSDNEDDDKENLVITEKVREDENGNELVEITISDKNNSFQEQIELSTKRREAPGGKEGWQPLEPVKQEMSKKQNELDKGDLHNLEKRDSGLSEDSPDQTDPTQKTLPSPQKLKYNVQVEEDETIILVIQGGRYSQHGSKPRKVITNYERLMASERSQNEKQIATGNPPTSNNISPQQQQQQQQQVVREGQQVQPTGEANTLELDKPVPKRGQRKRMISRGYPPEEYYVSGGKMRYSARARLSYSEICRPYGEERVVVVDDENENIDLVKPDIGVTKRVAHPQKRKYTKSKIPGRKKKRKLQ